MALPKSAMGQAIRYTLSNWDALCRYSEDGRIAIDNNAVERMLRIVTLPSTVAAGIDDVYGSIQVGQQYGVGAGIARQVGVLAFAEWYYGVDTRTGQQVNLVDKVSEGFNRIGSNAGALAGGISTVGKLKTFVTSPVKTPHNPYGKLGSPAHRAKVGTVVEDIELRGLRPDTEVPIRTVNGQKATRYMDVVARDPVTGQIVEVHQVGKALKATSGNLF